MIDFDKVNKINRKVYNGDTLQLDNIISVEFRIDLINNILKEDDFSIFFSKNTEQKHISHIERITNGLPSEFYITDFSNYKKLPTKGIKTNITGKNLLPYISKLLNKENFYINNFFYFNHYDSINLKGEHQDKYYYIDIDLDNKKLKKGLGLINKRFYNKNFISEILRYDYKTLELNKIYICHNHYDINDTYMFPIFEQYKPWQIFYYFTPDDLDNPKECLFDGRQCMLATKELFIKYFGTDNLPEYSDPENREKFNRCYIREAQWYWESIQAGKNVYNSI